MTYVIKHLKASCTTLSAVISFNRRGGVTQLLSLIFSIGFGSLEMNASQKHIKSPL